MYFTYIKHEMHIYLLYVYLADTANLLGLCFNACYTVCVPVALFFLSKEAVFGEGKVNWSLACFQLSYAITEYRTYAGGGGAFSILPPFFGRRRQIYTYVRASAYEYCIGYKDR